MIRIIAKLFAAAVALTVLFQVAPVFAGNVNYISSTGSDSNPCTAAQPCATFAFVLTPLGSGGQISCLDSPGPTESAVVITQSLTIDCAGVYETSLPNTGGFQLNGNNQVVKVRNLTISGTAGGYPAIKVTGSGTLIIENCVFENFNASGVGPALDIEPTGAFNLVITNSRISNNSAAGVLIKPNVGSVTATFDGVTMVNNAGGLHTDTTNGVVRVDISNSTISYNADNGMAIVGGTGTNMVTVKNGVIASNGQAGIEASGANAAVLVNNAVLDSNTGGAVSAVSGGRILTYGNNSTIGLAGTGFTGTAPLN
jgi:hypothetical protein